MAIAATARAFDPGPVPRHAGARRHRSGSGGRAHWPGPNPPGSDPVIAPRPIHWHHPNEHGREVQCRRWTIGQFCFSYVFYGGSTGYLQPNSEIFGQDIVVLAMLGRCPVATSRARHPRPIRVAPGAPGDTEGRGMGGQANDPGAARHRPGTRGPADGPLALMGRGRPRSGPDQADRPGSAARTRGAGPGSAGGGRPVGTAAKSPYPGDAGAERELYPPLGCAEPGGSRSRPEGAGMPGVSGDRGNQPHVA